MTESTTKYCGFKYMPVAKQNAEIVKNESDLTIRHSDNRMSRYSAVSVFSDSSEKN
jgi:hypothetical protein